MCVLSTGILVPQRACGQGLALGLDAGPADVTLGAMEVVEREVTVQIKPALQQRPRPHRAQRWHVVLLDSDAHTYEYVIVMLRTLFAHTVEYAFNLAQTVDKRGAAIIFTGHLELAELKLEQVHGFGADPLMGEDSKGPMRAVLRQADEDTDG